MSTQAASLERMQVAHAPSGPLARAVRSVVGYQYDDLTPGEHLGMPSTTLTLVLAVDDTLDVSLGGRRQRYRAIVGGLHTTAARIHHGTMQHGVQLALSPLACRALLGVPAGELAEQVSELDEIVGRPAERLLDALHGTTDLTERCRLAEASLPPTRPSDVRPEIRHAWRVALQSGGSATVESLAAAVGWSRRHLEQEWRRELGITPKQALRLRRFERSVALLRNRADLAETAAAAGFADQPHLSRDWKAFTGTSPARWRRADKLAFVQDSANALRHAGEHD